MKPHRIVISLIESAQADADIVIRPNDIVQAEIDIRALRSQTNNPDFVIAANALQLAVDVARAQVMCPALYAKGTKDALSNEAISEGASKLFRVAA